MKYNPVLLKKLMDVDKSYMLLESLGVNGLIKDSNGLRSSCPIHNSNNTSSFAYNYNRHLYICYSNCKMEQKEGDLINLVEYSKGYSYEEAVEYICDVCEIDIKLLEDEGDFLYEDVRLKIDNILEEISDDNSLEDDSELEFGVKPVDTSLLQKFLGLKDEEGFIDSQGFKDSTLELFESGYNNKEKRWLLPIKSQEGELLGFDGRDITNKSKVKWKKRKGLKLNKLLGRLDIIGEEIQKKNKIILCEGIKDQMALYEAGFKYATCIYGSSFSNKQKELVDNLIDGELIIAPDGDKAGFKMVQSIIKLCYPEYLITVIETPDDEDAADLSKKYLSELYDNRIAVEEWLNIYSYRTK